MILWSNCDFIEYRQVCVLVYLYRFTRSYIYKDSPTRLFYRLILVSHRENLQYLVESPPNTLNLRDYSHICPPTVHLPYTNNNCTLCAPTVYQLQQQYISAHPPCTSRNNNTFLCTHRVPMTTTTTTTITHQQQELNSFLTHGQFQYNITFTHTFSSHQ